MVTRYNTPLSQPLSHKGREERQITSLSPCGRGIEGEGERQGSRTLQPDFVISR